MARTGRYCYCPAAGKIHYNFPTIRERILRWLNRKNRATLLYPVGDYEQPCYPSGYKK